MIDQMIFRRFFSKSMYKTLKLPLGEMTFTKDFVEDKRGDLYPLMEKDELCRERVENNQYLVENGAAERMFTRFFPYATYEISFEKGGCGFVFHLPEQKAEIICEENAVRFFDGKTEQTAEREKSSCEATMVVSCRPGAFDVYFMKNGKAEYFCTFASQVFENANEYKVFSQSFVAVKAKGNAAISKVCTYIDCGISQADIRPIHYENGEIMLENGKVYLTVSIRIQQGGFQGIFSWVPSTSEIELTGALFFDCGDGFWRNYLASSLLYHREEKEWYLWTSSFEHKHILCHAAFAGEPRFGVNVVDVTMMEEANGEDYTAFVGFKGDEDPDFYYDKKTGKWNLAICRLCPVQKSYRYLFFESDSPFSGYTFIGQSCDGSETGGSFVQLNGETAFVCGDSFEKRACYRIYTKNGMHEAEFDFDDGGFRGWGTVLPITMGSRTRYYWLTFDRHNGSSYNWSYGNFYCFEGFLK